MRHYKRFLTSILAISLLITGIPITAYAEKAGTEDNRDENIKDDGTGGGDTQIQLGGGDWGNDNEKNLDNGYGITSGRL